MRPWALLAAFPNENNASSRESATAGPPRPAAGPAAVVPLAPAQYKIQFTAGAEIHAKVRQAQALLRHQIPSGDLAQIFDRALTVLLRDLTKQKVAATARPRSRRVGAVTLLGGSRRITAEVKRAVWTRDEGRCAFVAPNGRRCAEVGLLEFHHVVPYANGGSATPPNIELRCRAHNVYEATRIFGQCGAPIVRRA
jgi:hypothetical protein